MNPTQLVKLLEFGVDECLDITYLPDDKLWTVRLTWLHHDGDIMMHESTNPDMYQACEDLYDEWTSHVQRWAENNVSFTPGHELVGWDA